MPNPEPRGGEIWRIVEAQHKISTMKLVDNPAEQEILERLLDESKPPVPQECQHLHWLLFTPFRYEARGDSRFRRQGRTPPVFYAAENVDTAITEFSFWRLLFFAESPETPWPRNPLEATAFSVRYQTETCLDLTAPPYDDRAENWCHPTDYTATHAVADEARGLGCGAIRSWSARARGREYNVSLLSCAAFRDHVPIQQQSWHVLLRPAGVSARCETPESSLHFNRDYFDRDPRVARLDWER